MNNALYNFSLPENEKVLEYMPGSIEYTAVMKTCSDLMNSKIEIPLIIGGKEVFTGNMGNEYMPHNHESSLATYHMAGENEIKLAIDSALVACKIWSEMSWTIRASIMLNAAELISKKYRSLINAATMLGQSKNIFQAEIDAACETIDFLKYNAYFAGRIYQMQPRSAFDQLNRMEYKALEGFVFTVSPFNFTAIASNLSTGNDGQYNRLEASHNVSFIELLLDERFYGGWFTGRGY